MKIVLTIMKELILMIKFLDNEFGKYQLNNYKRISNRDDYTDNDWVINPDFENPITYDSNLNPYINFSIDNAHDKSSVELIICTTEKNLRRVLSQKISNKSIILLEDYNMNNLSYDIEYLIMLCLGDEEQTKVENRNFYCNEGNFYYSVRMDKVFTSPVYAFLKSCQLNNNTVYLPLELKQNYENTVIGHQNGLSIKNLGFLESTELNFNVVSRFNKYLLYVPNVLDFENQVIENSIKQELALPEYKFVKNAYLNLGSLEGNNQAKIIDETGVKYLDLPSFGVLDINLKKGQTLKFDEQFTGQVIVRNYLQSQNRIKNRFKRITYPQNKVASKLIMIYDPFDQGFVQTLDRTGAVEYALNDCVDFKSIKQFAKQLATGLKLGGDQIEYILDESVFIDEDVDLLLNENHNLIICKKHIHNQIRNYDRIVNFGQSGFSKLGTSLKQELCLLNAQIINNQFICKIPKDIEIKQCFLVINEDSLKTYYFENLKQGELILDYERLREFKQDDKPLTIAISFLSEELEYFSNQFTIKVEDESMGLTIANIKTLAYTYIQNDEEVYSSQSIAKLSQEEQVDTLVIDFEKLTQINKFSKDTYNFPINKFEELDLIMPLYAKTLGYEAVVKLKNGVVFEELIGGYISPEILNWRLKTSPHLMVQVGNELEYMYINLRTYEYFLDQLDELKHEPVNNLKPCNTIEHYDPNIKLYDFNHQFSPWKKVNQTEFLLASKQKHCFYNIELFDKYKEIEQCNVIGEISIDTKIKRNSIIKQMYEQSLKLSIIITTYNNEDSIIDTIHTIIDDIPLLGNQFELLLYDDCSPDSTVEVVKQHLSTMPNLNWSIKVNEVNKRYPGYGVNKGIQEARGEYLHIVDGDDKVINHIYRCLKNEHRADVISFGHYNYDIIRKEYVKANYYSTEEFEDEYPYQVSKKKFGQLQANVTHWNKMIKTKFLRENSIYYQENQLVQDNAFLTDVYFARPKVRHVPKMGYVYHIGQESVSSGRKGKKLFDYFTNANYRRIELINAFKPQYDYTMKRFMIFDEIKPEEFSQTVDVMRTKYAMHPEIKGIEFYGKKQILHMIMHTLLLRRDLTKINQFLVYTEVFKSFCDNYDSKYNDLYLRINGIEELAKALFAVKYVKEVIGFKDEEIFNILVKYIQDNLPQLIKEYDTAIMYAKCNEYYYETVFKNIVKQLIIIRPYVDEIQEISGIKLGITVQKLDKYVNRKFVKTNKKVIILYNPNDIIISELLSIDPAVNICVLNDEGYRYEYPHNANIRYYTEHEQIYADLYQEELFFIVLSGEMDLLVDQFMATYLCAYSLANDYIKLGSEDSDIFNIKGNYWINASTYSLKQLTHLSILDVHAEYENAGQIVKHNDAKRLYETFYVLEAYDFSDFANREYINRLIYQSPLTSSLSYSEHNRLNQQIYAKNTGE